MEETQPHPKRPQSQDNFTSEERDAKRRAILYENTLNADDIGDQTVLDTGNEPDEEEDELRLPLGWRQTPRIACKAIDHFIPIKVPLDSSYDKYIALEDRWSVEDAYNAALALLPPPPNPPGNVRMIVDLSKSSRYYDASKWLKLGVQYVKVPMRGRGEAPTPLSVNDVIWQVICHRLSNPSGYILMHCTHGFNRTGYVICQYLLRMQSQVYKTVPHALLQFAHSRPPGMYKHQYIRDLFRYNHEVIDGKYPFPNQPAWKAGDSPEQDHDEVASLEGDMQHDDVIGEEVSVEEAQYMQSFLMDAILGPVDPHIGSRHKMWFPGSQPVSLDRSNLKLLEDHRFWVTWKADGTRYMVAIMRWGTYLVDRRLNVRRVQMRWPTVSLKAPHFDVKSPHHHTLLDGEMVVDEDMTSGKRRRFLIYDVVMLNGRPLNDQAWYYRYEKIKSDLVNPRDIERDLIYRSAWNSPYRYDKELFGVRRKKFWPLKEARWVLSDFIPTEVLHESDGLILQSYSDHYKAGTDQELLKWKYAHMNSVDFRLRVHPKHGLQLELLETAGLQPGQHPDWPHGRPRGYVALPGAKVSFPNGEDPTLYDLRIIECCWEPSMKEWVFLRERRDKDTPNAFHVYDKVVQSIKDNILEEELLEYVERVMKSQPYAPDM